VSQVIWRLAENGYKQIQTVNNFKNYFSLALAALFVAGGCAAQAQQSFYERFRGQNDAMTAVQPSWMGPLIQSDSRLSQSVRLSFSNSYTPGRMQTTNYGNYHTLGLLAGNRIQFNFIAPPYIQNNSATAKDGLADTAVEVKYRIASGNAEHGNFTLTPMVAYSVATGSHQNGLLTAAWYPTLAAGRAWGRFNLQTTLGGMMPTGKIAAQGRSIEWNTTAQVHASAHAWLDLEDNAMYNYGGPFDRKTENWVTPAAFYVVRRKDWAPTHAFLVFDGGMQIATSGFHIYNHNLIAETRILF
jgi:hypothetical protein